MPMADALFRRTTRHDQTKAGLMQQSKTLWFYYRNARMWGKSVTWSIRYAREAAVTFA